MNQTIVKNEVGASVITIPGATPQQFDVFRSLRIERSLWAKERRCYMLRIPASMINGYSSCSIVSISPAVSNGEAYLIVGLTDASQNRSVRND